MAALPLCAITVVLGGVSVFTNSWARLNETHIGLFTTCGINVTSMASVCVEHGVAVCTRSPAEECYEGRPTKASLDYGRVLTVIHAS